ncbi:MAG: COX15/CtaA family protein [Phycisphaerae bacterium]|nr:COX15/CtaA family protein [Phycisphaerae bacterium]
MPSLCSWADAWPVTSLAFAVNAPEAVPLGPAQVRSWTAIVVLCAVFAGGAALVLLWARFARPVHLALGFAATATLWALGYVAMMQPGLIAGDALFAIMLAVVFAAGFIAGRFGGDDVRPVSVGLVSATANLLVLGAFIFDEKSRALFTPLLYVSGLFAASAALSWLGGYVGQRVRSRIGLPAPSAMFAAVAAITVFLLLITGGLVTSLESGLAVPDWPNSFGHNMLLYPISEMKGGVYYEHAHRLYGMLVGVTSLVLVSVIWRTEQREWLRALAIVLLVMVCYQGYLGGTRVTGHLTLEQDRGLLAPSTQRAIVHGVFAQLVFAAFLVIAAATTRTWRTTEARIGLVGSSLDRGAAMILPVAMFVQLILGALYRHLQSTEGGASAPGHPMWAILAHMIMAVAVTALVLLAAGRAWGHSYHPVLRRLGIALLAGVVLQFALGIGAVAMVWSRTGTDIPLLEVLLTTAHQATGAALFGATVLLAAWSGRLISAEESDRILPVPE